MSIIARRALLFLMLSIAVATSASAGTTAVINLVKLTNGTDNDTPPGPFVPVGSTVTFTYIVTNTGTAAVSSVALPFGA